MVGRGLRASQILTLLSPEADRNISALAGFLYNITALCYHKVIVQVKSQSGCTNQYGPGCVDIACTMLC